MRIHMVQEFTPTTVGSVEDPSFCWWSPLYKPLNMKFMSLLAYILIFYPRQYSKNRVQLLKCGQWKDSIGCSWCIFMSYSNGITIIEGIIKNSPNIPHYWYIIYSIVKRHLNWKEIFSKYYCKKKWIPWCASIINKLYFYFNKVYLCTK